MKIGIHGINGKMGQTIAESIYSNPQLTLAAVSVRQEHAWAGKKLSSVSVIASDIIVTSNLEILCQNSDVIIDFTRPDATLALLPVCQKYNRAVMIGTTGFNENVQQWIEQMSKHLPILIAANTSLGVNILAELSRLTAKAIDGKGWDIEIFEMHHRRKEDAPSGTALRLGEVIAEAQDSSIKDRKVYPYTAKRQSKDIGFSVVRGGDVVGEHTVYFINDDERIELTHRAQNRKIFSQGAILAAQWLFKKPAGLYGMADVLGFDKTYS